MAHILLAEDDESLRKFLAQALVKAGHDVTDFGDGGDAFECLKGFRFDLLVTDIVMPVVGGLRISCLVASICFLPLSPDAGVQSAAQSGVVTDDAAGP